MLDTHIGIIHCKDTHNDISEYSTAYCIVRTVCTAVQQETAGLT